MVIARMTSTVTKTKHLKMLKIENETNINNDTRKTVELAVHVNKILNLSIYGFSIKARLPINRC